jgi:hypothetical protein
MNDLHRIIVIGAGLGLSSHIASLFPEPKPAKGISLQDVRRMAAADAKRTRRAERMKANASKENSHV